MSQSAARRAWTCGLFCVLAALGLRSTGALLILRADEAALGRAAQLDPLAAEPYIQLARLDAAHAAMHRTAALRRNPWLTEVRLDLARDMSAISRHQEEGILLEAARRDRQSLPAWALAHYYWLHDRPDDFWRWAAHCARVIKDDRRGLLRLARMAAVRWRVPVEEVPERLNAADRSLERDLLNQLLLAGDLSASGRVVERVLSRAESLDTPVLAAYLERLLEVRDAGAATRLWDQMCRRGLLQAVASGGRAANWNASFRPPAEPPGFDWRLSPTHVALLNWGGPLRLRLDGQQPEVAELAWQYVPLRRGRYRLSSAFSVDSREPPPEGGELRWELLVGGTRHSLALPHAPEQTVRTLTVTIDSTEELGRLALMIRRQPGVRRLVGELAVFRTELVALDAHERGPAKAE